MLRRLSDAANICMMHLGIHPQDYLVRTLRRPHRQPHAALPLLPAGCLLQYPAKSVPLFVLAHQPASTTSPPPLPHSQPLRACPSSGHESLPEQRADALLAPA